MPPERDLRTRVCVLQMSAFSAQRKVGALSSSHRNNTRPGAAFRRICSLPRQQSYQAAEAKMYVPTDAFGGLNPEQVAANVLKKTCTMASMEVIRIRVSPSAALARALFVRLSMCVSLLSTAETL
eukprot:1183904-Prorocentrum_minimum.AAC.1